MTTLIASDLEIKVHRWLTKRRIQFEFQSQLIGGWGRQLGDTIADFILTEPRIILRVQGEYWHRSVNERARDRIQKERLTAMGYKVVDLWEENLEDDKIDETMRNAMIGREMP